MGHKFWVIRLHGRFMHMASPTSTYVTWAKRIDGCNIVRFESEDAANALAKSYKGSSAVQVELNPS